MGFKKILFGKKYLGLGLQERDFTRFWINKYNHCLIELIAIRYVCRL